MSTDLHTLSGAYALDAVSPEEAAEFDKHLAECETCRLEVAELRAVAATMGDGVKLAPPPGLKAKVLAGADRTPQQPPKVTSLEDVRRRGWLPRLAVAAAAAVVVAGGAIGVAQLGQDELDPGVQRVFEATDANLAEVQTDHGLVRVATSPGRNEMAVDASGLEELDEELDYVVWSIAGGQFVPVTALDGDVDGASMPMPAPGTEVAITVEPAGVLSEAPSGAPIVQVDPAQV